MFLLRGFSSPQAAETPLQDRLSFGAHRSATLPSSPLRWATARLSSPLRRAARPSSPLRRTARPSSPLQRRATARPSTPLQRAARPRRLPHGGGQPLGRARLYGGLPGPAGRGSPLWRDALQSQIARSNKMQHASIVQGGLGATIRGLAHPSATGPCRWNINTSECFSLLRIARHHRTKHSLLGLQKCLPCLF